MKNNNTKSVPDAASSDDLLDHYDLDYRQAQANRFAKQYDPDQITVLLDPDVAQVFTNSQDVNALLRALIQTMPVAKD